MIWIFVHSDMHCSAGLPVAIPIVTGRLCCFLHTIDKIPPILWTCIVIYDIMTGKKGKGRIILWAVFYPLLPATFVLLWVRRNDRLGGKQNEA